MPVVTVRRVLPAPPALVFALISDIDQHAAMDPDVVGVEHLTDQRSGPGARFRETRRMGRRTQCFELQVLAYDPEAYHYRTTCDADGVTWDTRMTVCPDPAGSVLEMAMRCEGQSWGKRLMTWVFQPLFRRGMRRHCDRLEAYIGRSAMAQSRS